MSRKGKKRAKGKFRQPMRPAGPLTSVAASGTGAQTAAPSRSVSQARVGGDQATVRAVEMSLGARNEIRKGRGGRFVVESADPSIPLARHWSIWPGLMACIQSPCRAQYGRHRRFARAPRRDANCASK